MGAVSVLQAEKLLETCATMWLYSTQLKSVRKDGYDGEFYFTCILPEKVFWDTWVAQSIKRPTSAQVTISRFVGSSPALGSVLTARSLEPVLDSVSPLSLPLPHSCSVSLCLKNK